MDYHIPRCQIVPLPDYQVSFRIDNHERLRWHFGPSYPRPFFYPLVGPSGASLTRMGHPGAPNHDHHRSIWFAHHDVAGADFWSDQTEARIRQKNWLCYQDGDDEAVMACSLGWYRSSDGPELLEQELLAAILPESDGESLLELKTTLRPVEGVVELGRTNFGLLAVRVAKSISAYFGGGQLRDSEGRVGEAEIFGNAARWVDYSGPVLNGQQEGITYFDHPSNPGAPAHWHVRKDGWMGASVCMHGVRAVTRETPLTVRYLVHAHRGRVESHRAARLLEQFTARPALQVERSGSEHTHCVARRTA